MVYAMARSLTCQWGKNRDSAHGAAWGVRVVRARPWREFKTVHITAHIGTPCHSIVAPSLLIVYELFTKWHETGTTISPRQVVTPWKNSWTFQNSRHDMDTQYFTWRASQSHAYQRTLSQVLSTIICVPWRKPFVVQVRVWVAVCVTLTKLTLCH